MNLGRGRVPLPILPIFLVILLVILPCACCRLQLSILLNNRPFQDLLHSKCTTHRGELGRPTPRVPRVFLTFFFPGLTFWVSTEILLIIDKLQKLDSRSLQTLWEWKNRVLLEEYYIFNGAIPPEDESSKLQQYATQIIKRMSAHPVCCHLRARAYVSECLFLSLLPRASL